MFVFLPEEGSRPETIEPQLQEKQMSLVLDAAQASLRLRLWFSFGCRISHMYGLGSITLPRWLDEVHEVTTFSRHVRVYSR